MVKINTKGSKKGFILLFAVTLAGMLLAIALGVSDMALKELNFSTSARDTNEALFAADTGIECALYNDKSTVNKFRVAGPASAINCTGNTVTYSSSGTPGTGNGVGIYDFAIGGLGNVGKSCVKVNVRKTELSTSSIINTVVTAKGYYPDSTSDCSSTAANRIERQLDVRYGDRRNLASGKCAASFCTGTTDPGYPISNLTDGDLSTQVYPGGTSFSYEVDLVGSGAAITVSTIRLALVAGGASDPQGCDRGYGFPRTCPTFAGPYIDSWQVDGDSGSGGGYINLAQSSASPNGTPYADVLNISLPTNTNLKKIKFSAQSTFNWIGVYELEAY